MMFTQQYNIGLLVIATNKYIQFVTPLWESAKKYFMSRTPHNINMFIFTNSREVPEDTFRIQHEHRPWPYPTLMRYHAFTKNSNILEKMDYLYYSDADMRFEGFVGEEILGDLVATQHPGFWDKPRSFFSQSYEDRPESMAFMPDNKGTAYYAGGFNGGKSSEYLKMSLEISKWIDKDSSNGIIAKWHDESYMNKYFSEHIPTVVLNPSYCYQEEKQMPFPRKIVALKKDHDAIRS